MPVPIVIDLSHWNTISSSLKPAAESGIVGVIHKATEGASNVDKKVDARYALAKQAGLLWGLYHFLRPGDQRAHARHFISIASQFGDDQTLLAADHEDAKVSLSDLKVFLREVEALSGRYPVIYSGHVLKDQLKGKEDPEIASYRLWLAQYSSQPVLPPGFDAYWIWQYTDKGEVAGVNPPTDLNAGDAADVRARWSGSGVSRPGPAPSPEPEEEKTVTVAITAPDNVLVEVIVNGELVS